MLMHAVYHRKKDNEDQERDEKDLKWRFKKESGGIGIYGDFVSLPPNQKLVSHSDAIVYMYCLLV